jgi:[glutamine synthetase] adenylyltransferase / [glutamine synthetase]-adenylyl-L-tyrosine phosphorylase
VAVADSVDDPAAPFRPLRRCIRTGHAPEHHRGYSGPVALDRVRESSISVLARRGFSDPAAATALLAGPALGELGRDPMLLDALSRTGDPDLALDSLARLLEAAPDKDALRNTLASSKPLRDRLLGVLGVSAALGDFLTRHPDSWHALEEFDTGDLVPDAGWFRSIMLHAVGAEPVESGAGNGNWTGNGNGNGNGGGDGAGGVRAPIAQLTGDDAEDALRVAYRRLLLAVTARDVVASADLPVVAADLADLAGATLEAALAVARAEEPEGSTPCRLAVIGMGKCGARELNYVSDVDVIFVGEPCPADASPDGKGSAGTGSGSGFGTGFGTGTGSGSRSGPVADQVDDGSALRSATRLASRMMRLCSDVTSEGMIWQVDAALRPEGKAGPLVRTLASHAAYYQRWAKTWEFQALLKARPVAGDAALGAAYLKVVEPLVWSAATREKFVEDVQAMRRRVVDHTTSSLRRAPGSVGVDRELKLGPGGLRDVEFAVQLLQLVHGRSDESLRVRSTLDALKVLAQGGYVGREDAAHLSDAYRFLRTVEHRIQLFRLERTHTMPEDPAALRRIGRSMGWTAAPADELRQAWKSHALEVRRLHEKLFYRPLLTAVAQLDEASAAVPSAVGPSPRLSAAAARSRLAALGYADPVGAMANIAALTTGVSRRAAIQRTLLPVLLGWFADAPDPDAGLLNFRRVSDALGSTPWYLRSLRDEGEAAWRLATVLSSGAYAPDLLMRAPESVALLNDDNALKLRGRAALETEMIALVQRSSDAEQAVTAIRAVRRRELFRIAAADLLGMIEPDEGAADPSARSAAGQGGGAGAGRTAGSGRSVGLATPGAHTSATHAGGAADSASANAVVGAAASETGVASASAGAKPSDGVATLATAGTSAGTGTSSHVDPGAADSSPGLGGSTADTAETGVASTSPGAGTSDGVGAQETAGASAGAGSSGGVEPLETSGASAGSGTSDGIGTLRTLGASAGAGPTDSVGAVATVGASGPPTRSGGLDGLEHPAGGDRLDRLGWALSDLTAATLEATLRAVSIHRSGRHAGEPLPTRFAIIAMGRFGGRELGYGSDADVVFVHEPMPGADAQAASEAAFDVANELRRLLQAPAADPPLLIDADLRPEGRQGPLVRSLAAYAEYYRRWSRVWESQALLRATPVAGDAGVGARFVELIDPIRYPADGLPEAEAREIRRLKARMEAERLPRGADRALHTKLGPGGLSDVEWAVQLLQLQYGGQVPALRTTGTRAAMRAAVAAGLLAEEDKVLLEAAWCESTRMRNGITVVRGRPGDQVPTSPRELAGIGRYLYAWDQGVPGSASVTAPGAYEAQGAHAAHKTRGYGYSGDPAGQAGQGAHRLDNEALLDMHRRTTRRARAVFERLFYG